MRWSASELARLRCQTDPEIDKLVAFHRHRHPELTDLRRLLRSLIRELDDTQRNPGGHHTVLDDPPDLPLWGKDAAQIRRGQAVFVDYALYQAAALMFASLPMAYAAVGSAEVLVRVSDLATANLTRRIAETGQMLLDVMGVRATDALEPGGPGYTSAIGLRLLHAYARLSVLEQDGRDRWPTERFGPPINQELLLATLLDFTIVPWEALERMGIQLADADRAAHLYTWSVVGYLMGLDACRHQPLTLADVNELSALLSRRLGPSDAGRRLMGTLLAEMEQLMHLGWRKLPRSLVRWLFRDAPHGIDRVPDLLGVPPAAWWSAPLFASLRAAHRRAWLLGPLRLVARWVIRKAGRHALIACTNRFSNGQVPYRIPDELARRWQIQQCMPRAGTADAPTPATCGAATRWPGPVRMAGRLTPYRDR
jgi:ER-bound oxygenase mpaB/B'/Rubber oxygenase, catalytic domain